MAYFLPQSFQKRILRFALSRLDFIDSQALDLDNLGVSIGQRSTVELKNVAIDVKKLTSKFPLPPFIGITKAIIHLLRITIPADLHLSGIQVEVDGICVEAEIQEVRSKPGNARSGASRSARPARTSITTVLKSPDLSASHILPTPDDLAQTFLLEEPESEKKELSAAVQSQSGLLQRTTSNLSSSSVSSNDVDGQAEGFSLPGFVANFFAGVTDRLSVQVKSVEITVTTYIGENSSTTPFRLVLKLAEIKLTSLRALTDFAPESDLRRAVSISGVEVYVACDFESPPQRSSSGSPLLSRGLAVAHSHGVSDVELTDDRSRAPILPQALLTSPQLLASGLTTRTLQSPVPLLADQVPDLKHEAYSKSTTRSPSVSEDGLTSGDDSSDDNEDLSESRYYSHDQAQSMYMSAISGSVSEAVRIPGDWHSQSHLESTKVSSDSTRSTFDTVTNKSPAKESSIGRSAIESSPRFAKRLCTFSSIDLKIPNIAAAPLTPRTPTAHNSVTSQRSPEPDRRAVADYARNALDTSHYKPTASHDVQVEFNSCYEARIGQMTIDLDMGLCHTLLQALSRAIRTPGDAAAPEPTNTAPQDAMQLAMSMETVEINLLQDVPLRDLNVPAAHASGDHLLQIQARRINFQSTTADAVHHQTFSIQRFSIQRQSEGVLYFHDSTNNRESFIAATVLIEPNDIVIRKAGNRVNVSMKPVHITLDLPLVDDVLSRSGGLSSFLDLAASITSSGTAKTEKVQRSTSARDRPRSVRFNEPSQSGAARSSNDTSPKVDARISGATIVVKGSTTSVSVKTSSLKTAYRASGLRANIASMSIKGPSSLSDSKDKGVSARLSDFEFVYLNSPLDEDLDRLLSLITPSNDKYEENDDILVDTLIRQRRKGGVARIHVRDTQVSIDGLAWLSKLDILGEEVAKLSTITKYLPEDDRPGLLTFGLLTKVDVSLALDSTLPPMLLSLQLVEGALISVPSLMAGQVSAVGLNLGKDMTLLRELVPNMQASTIMGPPMLMARFIADEMEPTVKVKLSNTCVEYSVSTLLTVQRSIELAQFQMATNTLPHSPHASEASSSTDVSAFSRKARLLLVFRNVAVLLKPVDSPAAGLFVLTDATLNYRVKSLFTAARLDVKRATFLLIDDSVKVGGETSTVDPKLYFDQNDQIQELVQAGFVPIASLSAASIDLSVREDKSTHDQHIDVELRNNLLFLETCADSTQTLFQVLGGLSPPAPPEKIAKYRTEQQNIVPIQDLLASFSGNGFVSERGPDLGLQVDSQPRLRTSPLRQSLHSRDAEDQREDVTEKDSQGYEHGEDEDEDEDEEDDEEEEDDDESLLNDLYQSQAEDPTSQEMVDTVLGSTETSYNSLSGSVHVAPVGVTADNLEGGQSVMMHSMLDFRDDHFKQNDSVAGTAHRWEAKQNTYGLEADEQVRKSPLNFRVRDVHFIWNLFDGYDWQSTREVITQAVRDIEDKVVAKQTRRSSRRSPMPDDEDESVVGDVLFNSIYISIPTYKNAQELTNDINMQLGDNASETGSYATGTTVTATTSKRYSTQRTRPKKLRLDRSKHHKMTFELEGLSADFITLPSGSVEVESSLDVRARKIEIFDHVPTSTWKKFLTYMHEAGERETASDMVHIELLNVKPVAELSASEIVMKLTVLPLRLHVDQDALDFMTRFFEFKDDRLPSSNTPSTPPFIQRAEVNPIKLRLDFKPKRVNYSAIRSGHTSEFMNFVILDRADIALRRVILYGVSGFDRLGIMLNNIWTPDVTKNQLPTVLAGLAPVRSLVDVGAGVKDLVAVPIREYRKDGRLVRAVQKGALAFAKTTTTELVNFGAKLAIGTQAVLQNAEDVLAPQTKAGRQTGLSEDGDDEQPKHISLYADQPVGIISGLRGAYTSLERDLLLAKDAIIAVPGEIMAEGNAIGAARVVLKQSPTIILRPAIGVTKAVGQALLGAGNTLDKGKRRRMEDKYKRN